MLRGLDALLQIFTSVERSMKIKVIIGEIDANAVKHERPRQVNM